MRGHTERKEGRRDKIIQKDKSEWEKRAMMTLPN